MDANLQELLEKHRQLDRELTPEARRRFLSEWDCDNPLLEEYLGPSLSKATRDSAPPSRYIYLDDEHQVTQQIRHFHATRNEKAVERQRVIAGPGSSSLLAAFTLWLRANGISHIHYLPPAYYTLHYWLDLLSISCTAVSDRQPIEEGFSLELPETRTVLLMCDPIWYAGRTLSSQLVEEILRWQLRTGSVIFVDGSFQYMRWDGKGESTAELDPALTFRLVSPAKSLALPPLRFAYLLVPPGRHEELLFLYENLVGAFSGLDLALAQRALDILASPASNRSLIELLKGTYLYLASEGLVETALKPNCGYFMFGRPIPPASFLIGMDGSFFGLRSYTSYQRINLFGARRLLRSESSTRVAP